MLERTILTVTGIVNSMKLYGLIIICVIDMCAVCFATQYIDFAGYEWEVRVGHGGPGPNYWSSKCVWVDSNGWLHLEIKKIDSAWRCGQVGTDEALGFGDYRWYLASPIDGFDDRTVGGVFTYLNDRKEVDVEFTEAFSTNGYNMNYTVQPYYIPENQYQIRYDGTDVETTHRFLWTPDAVTFQSWIGHSDEPNEDDMIAEWTFSGKGVPPDWRMRTYMNVWLFRSQPPREDSCRELVFKDFKFIPWEKELKKDE